MKTRQIAHNDYPAARYRSPRVLYDQPCYMEDAPAVLSAGTQMVSRNHTVANDGTDNDDLDDLHE